MKFAKWLDWFKKYFTWIILAINVAVMISIIRGDEEYLAAFSRGTHMHPGWMAAACGIFLLSVSLEGVLLRLILGWYGTRYPLWRSLRIALVTRYYSAITPTNLGGQPAAILRLIGDGVTPTAAGMSVGMHVVFFQFGQLILQLVMLGFLPGLHLSVNPILWIALGLSIFLGGGLPLVLLLSLLLPSWTQKAIHAIGTAGEKFRLIKDREAFCQTAQNHIAPYRDGLRSLSLLHKMLVILLAMGQVLLLNLVAYAACRACGVDPGLWNSLWRMLFLNTAVNFLPIPGGIGAAEGSFYLIFGPVVPKGRIMLALILWRTASYFLLLALGIAESTVYALCARAKRRNASKSSGSSPVDHL